MNTDFKILNTEYYDYKNKEYMSLMLIREYDKYSVEVISNTMSHGRIYMASHKDAQILFDSLNTKIIKLNSFKSTSDMLKLIKNTKDLKSAMFIIAVFGKKLKQDTIGRLMTVYNFKVKSKINKDDSMRIRMYFAEEKSCFGIFKGTFLKNNFVFEKA